MGLVSMSRIECSMCGGEIVVSVHANDRHDGSETIGFAHLGSALMIRRPRGDSVLQFEYPMWYAIEDVQKEAGCWVDPRPPSDDGEPSAF